MEDSLPEKNGLYTLPLNQKANLKWSLHILFGLMEAMLVGFVVIPGDDQVKVILNMLFLVFVILVGYLWLAMALFQKPHLIITDEYLEYKWLFGHKIIHLNRIYNAEFFSDRGVTKLGIQANEQGKPSFWDKSDRLFGMDYSVSIVVTAFHHIDFEKLRITLLSKSQGSSHKSEN